MHVEKFFAGGKSYNNHEANSLISSDLPQEIVNSIRDAIIFNNDSRVEMSDEAMYVPEGNGTEVGLLRFLTSNEYAIEELYIAKERKGVIET